MLDASGSSSSAPFALTATATIWVFRLLTGSSLRLLGPPFYRLPHSAAAMVNIPRGISPYRRILLLLTSDNTIENSPMSTVDTALHPPAHSLIRSILIQLDSISSRTVGQSAVGVVLLHKLSRMETTASNCHDMLTWLIKK